MKLPLTVIVAAALASGLAALAVYRAALAGGVIDGEALGEVPRLVDDFARGESPELTFSLADLPQWATDPVLVDTAGASRDSQQYCGGDDGDDGARDKAARWYG